MNYKGVLFAVVTISFFLILMSFVRTHYIVAQIDLTGVWKSNDGGNYYLRQLGTTLYWVGMSPNEGHDWTNVFVGNLNGNTVSGNWADVPLGTTLNAGSLMLEISNDGNHISIEHQNGGFGPSVFDRIIEATPTSPHLTPAPTPTPSEPNKSGCPPPPNLVPCIGE